MSGNVKKKCPVLQTIEYLKERTLTFSPGTKSSGISKPATQI